MARSSVRRYTAASSLVSKPTITFGSVCAGRRFRTASRMLGLSLAAQPAALAVVVNRTASVNSASGNANRNYSAMEATVRNLQFSDSGRERRLAIQACAAADRMGIVMVLGDSLLG